MSKKDTAHVSENRGSGGSAAGMQEEVAVTAGEAGLGLMGTSIVAALLAAGHRVIGLTRSLARHSNSREIVLERMAEMKEAGLLQEDPFAIIDRLQLGVNWQPTEAERAYNEGRSTQVPVNPVVRIQGRFSRWLRDGNLELVLER